MAGKPFNHPDYRIEGTGLFSFSRWKRENDPAPPPKYKVGDVVVVTRVMEITEVSADCDGSPLYALDNDLFGIGESSLRLATEEEAENA